MDSEYSDQGWADASSHHARSRASSSVSTAEGRFRHLHLADSPALSPSPGSGSRPPSSRGPLSPTSSTYISSLSPPSTATTYFPSVSAPHTPASFILASSDQVLDASWFETSEEPLAYSQPHGTPLLRLDPAQEYYQPPISSPSSVASTSSAAMGTVAVQFDSGFDNMGSRSAFTWPLIESGSSLLGHDLSAYGSEASMTPPSGSRSITGSPPRGNLTPEQRAFRQHNQARREIKQQARMRRAGSGSSYTSDTPSVPLSDLSTSASALPIYTSAPSQISLLTEPATTLAPDSYLPSYPSDQETTSVFPATYQPTYLPVDYSAYPPTSNANLGSQYGRPTLPVQDPSMLYSVPPIMTTGNAGLANSPEAGHVRVVQSRPKPQCWEHGCNGRQFSTFSNLLRHQREKSGQAAKATCPNCGAEFTRTTARNGHLLHDKCKQKRNSTGSIG